MRYQIRDLGQKSDGQYTMYDVWCHTSYIILFCLLLFSCQKTEEMQSKKIAAEVLQIHDEVMPKMDNVQALKKKIKEQTTAQNKLISEALIQKLDSADNGMMDWMAEYKVELTNKTEADKTAYYIEEKQKIGRVKIQMEEALKAAEAFLTKK